MTTSETTAQNLIARLKEKKLTITSAESCTGGAFMHALVAVPGASEVFRGGLVAYCDDVKVEQLSVKRETINHYGVVSEQVALEMALGIRKKFRTDISIATTGYAHTGKVCFAFCCAGDNKTFTKNFDNLGREEVIDASVHFLINNLYEKV